MMRSLTAVGVVLGVLLTAPLAGAQNKGSFGQQGEFIIDADRLMPLFAFTNFSVTPLGPPVGQALGPNVSKVSDTVTQTSLSLLWGSTSNGLPASPSATNTTFYALETFFTVPRIGADYVLLPNFTVGGDVIFFTTLGGHTQEETDFSNGQQNRTITTGNPSALVFGLAPRAGYVLALSDLLSIWLRGGLSYYIGNYKTQTPGPGNTTTTDTFSANQFALDLEPQLVITPVQHFGITAGLNCDIPIAGGHSETIDTQNQSVSASAGSSIFFFGAHAGLLGWF
jgi:hypothetical protein